MYTLKIKWQRREKGVGLVDETTKFIAADEVTVHSEIKSMDEMVHWEQSTFLDYSMPFESEDGVQKVMKGTRLIHVVHKDIDTWYVASLAWLLGPDGKTIERLT